ncbi:hypothetical protein PSPO01_04207 [Paraphaeosphaeria sporulosa]
MAEASRALVLRDRWWDRSTGSGKLSGSDVYDMMFKWRCIPKYQALFNINGYYHIWSSDQAQMRKDGSSTSAILSSYSPGASKGCNSRPRARAPPQQARLRAAVRLRPLTNGKAEAVSVTASDPRNGPATCRRHAGPPRALVLCDSSYNAYTHLIVG